MQPHNNGCPKRHYLNLSRFCDAVAIKPRLQPLAQPQLGKARRPRRRLSGGGRANEHRAQRRRAAAAADGTQQDIA